MMGKRDVFELKGIDLFLADEEDDYCGWFDGLRLPYDDRGSADAAFVDAIFYGLLDIWEKETMR